MELAVIFMSCFSFGTVLYFLSVEGKQSQKNSFLIKVNEHIQRQMNSDIYMLAARVLEGKKKTPPAFEERLEHLASSAREIYEKVKKESEAK